MTTLNVIRYYTQDDAYHYATDNRPLQDLESNDLILKASIDDITTNTTTQITVGNWATLAVALDFNSNKGKPFAYRIRIWGTKDQSLTSTQSSTLSEDMIFGYCDIAGNVNVQQVTNILNQSIGTGALVKTFTGSGTLLMINFSGYTGLGGYVLVKAERFGI